MKSCEIDSMQRICNDLKKILSCPLCSDTIQDIVELGCGHRYCRKCLYKPKSTKKVSQCHLCKFKITRRSILYKDEVANLFGKFVHNVQNILHPSEEKSIQVLESCNIKKPYNTPNKENRPIEDAFDALLGTSKSVLNWKTLKRTYSNRSKEVKLQLNYKILEFDNSETKDKVVKWLDDTRNKFDRLTQTQNISEEHFSDVPINHGPSVSQAKLCKGILRTRAKSLDNEVTNDNTKKKRYTDGCNEILENYLIEQFSNDEEKAVERAEEKVIILIEDEILNKFEKEIIPDVRMENDNKKPQNLETSQTSVSGWDRITKIEKTLKNKEKTPEQLHIILQPFDGPGKKVASSTKQKIKFTSTSSSIGVKKATRSNKNISHDNSDDLEIAVLDSEEKEIKSLGVSCKRGIINKKQQNKSVSNISRSYTSDRNRSNNLESDILAQQGEQSEKPPANSTKNSVTEEIENVKLPNNNQINNRNEVEENKIVLESIHENQDEDVYLIPTQPITNLIKSQCCVETFDEEYHSLLNNEKLETSINMRHIQSFEDSLNIIINVLHRSNANNSLSNEDVVSIKTCLQNLRILYSQKHSKKETTDATVQTIKQISNDITTQTDIKELKSISTQHSILSAHVQIQTDNSNNIPHQVENNKLKNIKVAQSSKELLAEELDCFAGTLDNFNFETQEVTKYADSTNVMTKEQIPVNINKIVPPKSASISNLDTSRGTERINRRLKYTHYDQPTKNKRKRQVLDSDSEDEIISKVKYNRFKRNDLSIEFETQLNSDPTKKSQLSAGSGSLDYDNYLVEVMKKYDEGELFLDKTKTESKVIDRESPRVTDSDRINMQINNNIKNIATVLRGDSVSSDSFKTSSQGNSCDIIGRTETPETIPKNIEQVIKLDKAKNSKSGLIDNDIFDEFNDGFEDAILDNLAKDIHVEKPRINIVQDIIIETKKQDEDVIFSDDDIVETTPNKLKRCRTTNINQSKTEDILAFDDFDIEALPPPTEFQDNPNVVEEKMELMEKSYSIPNENKENQYQCNQSPERRASIVSDTSSLTPDLSQYITLRSRGNNNVSVRDQIKTPRGVKRAKLEHSTPAVVSNVDRETLGFSPISGKDNIVYLTPSIKTTPLSNIPNDTFKQNILTSTPKQKSIWNYVKSSKSGQDYCNITTNKRIKPCVACTRLSKDQIMSISQMTNKKLVTYSTTFDATVTHMIVSVDDRNCLKDYTVKSVAAIAAGIWVLRFEWVQDCLAQNAIVNEEPYEVMDCSGLPGPKTSRLTRKDRPLFQGYKFYCVNPFYSTTQQDIQDVIRMLGGKVVSHLSEMSQKDDRIGLIIAEVKASQDLEVFENYLEKYKVPTVDIEWLSKSVGRYQILSIRPYVWCSDDRLDDLNYPPFLVEHVSTATEYNM